MQMSSGTTNPALLGARLRLSFASYLLECNFILEAIVGFYNTSFRNKSFRSMATGGSDSPSALRRAKYFSRASVIRFRLGTVDGASAKETRCSILLKPAERINDRDETIRQTDPAAAPPGR